MFLLKDPLSKITTDGKKITCTRNEMQLTLSRATFPWLQPGYFDMHLRDKNCRPYHVNSTHIIVKTTYGDCKTVAKTSSRDVIYRNVLKALATTLSAIPGTLATRVPDVLFPFQCRFDREQMDSIPLALKPEQNNTGMQY